MINVIDVEATCWPSPKDKPADETSDIIEIGITELHPTEGTYILVVDTIPSVG